MSVFKDKVLLITGRTGSFGSAVLRCFMDCNVEGRGKPLIKKELEIKVIETHHGKKLYETLVTCEEMARHGSNAQGAAQRHKERVR